MKENWYLLWSIICLGLIGCGGDDSNSTVGSSSQTNAEIDSLNLTTISIPSERLFVLNNPTNPSITFSLSSVDIESNIENSSVRLAVGSPVRISVKFDDYAASDPNSVTGFSVDFKVANYTAEQLISDSRPSQNRFNPIGTWIEEVTNSSGTVIALCRAVDGDFGGPAYNCRNSFDVQGFGSVTESFAEIGAAELHLLMEISGTLDLSGGLTNNASDDGPISFLTSIPISID